MYAYIHSGNTCGYIQGDHWVAPSSCTPRQLLRRWARTACNMYHAMSTRFFKMGGRNISYSHNACEVSSARTDENPFGDPVTGWTSRGAPNVTVQYDPSWCCWAIIFYNMSWLNIAGFWGWSQRVSCVWHVSKLGLSIDRLWFGVVYWGSATPMGTFRNNLGTYIWSTR